MDILAHGLWGSAAFGRRSRWQWRGAFLLGVAPDLLSFGPFVIRNFGNSNWRDFPAYVHQSYNVTHSLLVWSAMTAFIWFFRKRFPWILGAWGLHILCDIPTHELNFFPTPYLWPLPTPFINGMHWAQPRIMIANYLALTATYVVVIRHRRNRRQGIS